MIGIILSVVALGLCANNYNTYRYLKHRIDHLELEKENFRSKVRHFNNRMDDFNGNIEKWMNGDEEWNMNMRDRVNDIAVIVSEHSIELGKLKSKGRGRPPKSSK
jgi:hypothetical protein